MTTSEHSNSLDSRVEERTQDLGSVSPSTTDLTRVVENTITSGTREHTNEHKVQSSTTVLPGAVVMESDPVAMAYLSPIVSASGIVKVTSGVLGIATPGTDYQMPLVAGVNYEVPLSFSLPLGRTVNTISIPKATTLVDGYLSAGDWSTFNAKQPAGSYLTVETDPVFVAWDKSTGISITESQISDLQSYLTVETDPVWNSEKSSYSLVTHNHNGVYEVPLTFDPPLHRDSNDVVSIVEEDPVAMGYINQSVKTDASPTFADLNITDETSGYKVDGERILSLKRSGSGVNLFIGQAGNFTMTGIVNTFIGYHSGLVNTWGEENFGLGPLTLSNNTEGYANTAIGVRGLYSNVTGIRNVAIGRDAGYASIGDNNVFIGQASGFDSTGSNNVFIGFCCGRWQTTLSNLLIIDGRIRDSAAAEITDSLLYGVFATTPANQSFRINAGTIKLHTLSGLLKGTTGVVSVITDNSANWNTAYSWGNHGAAGYHSGTLTAGRIPYASSASVLTDVAGFTIDVTNFNIPVETIIGGASSQILFDAAAAVIGLYTDTDLITLASGAVVIAGSLTINANNIITDTTTGLKIGTGTTQKLGFFNATPIVQRSAYTQTYATADKTHANPTATTVTATSTSSSPWGYTTQVMADAVVTAINNLIVDVADVKKLVNSIIDDFQSLGLAA